MISCELAGDGISSHLHWNWTWIGYMGKVHRTRIKLSVKLSYLSDSIVYVSYKLLKVKLKFCTGFSAIPNFFVVYFLYWVWNFMSCTSTLKRINIQGIFHVGKANKAQCVFWGHFLLRITKMPIEFLRTAQNLWIKIVWSSIFECASKRSSCQMFLLSGRVNIP
jgi:hypothetical protein